MGEHRHRVSGGSGWLYMALMGSVIALVAGLSSVTSRLGPVSVPIWLGVMVMGTVAALGPIGKAIAKRITGDVATADQQPLLSEEMYAELDDLRARMAEMEERQDFAERLLAGGSDGARAPGVTHE